jgi:hypothetical protein
MFMTCPLMRTSRAFRYFRPNGRLRMDCADLGFLPVFAFRILFQNPAKRQRGSARPLSVQF